MEEKGWMSAQRVVTTKNNVVEEVLMGDDRERAGPNHPKVSRPVCGFRPSCTEGQ
jgi:hypothetical protein